MLDRTDKAILNALLEDATASYRRIARKAGVSLGTVMNRMRRLKESGIIRKSIALIDYEKAGYTIGVLIDVRVSRGRLFEVERSVARHPNVFAVYDITGDFDMAVSARFRSRRELDNFLKDLQRREFVERTHTKLILNYIKEEPPPFVLGMR